MLVYLTKHLYAYLPHKAIPGGPQQPIKRQIKLIKEK